MKTQARGDGLVQSRSLPVYSLDNVWR
jgi:hypothetical protein